MKHSAGILLYRNGLKGFEVLITHPGGPIWGKRDVWSIPKGELDADEDHITAAKREFTEETGCSAPTGEYLDLGTSKQPGKTNYIWAVEGDFDIKNFSSNSFEMQWPPRSGQLQTFPENDRAMWMDIAKAKQKVFPAQQIFIDRLAEALHATIPLPPEQQSLL